MEYRGKSDVRSTVTFARSAEAASRIPESLQRKWCGAELQNLMSSRELFSVGKLATATYIVGRLENTSVVWL